MSTGRFSDPPLCNFIAADPYGERPEPYLTTAHWDYVQCETCKQAFHKRVLSPDWTEHLFQRWMTKEAIDEFERTYNSSDHGFTKAIGTVEHILRIEKLTRSIRKREVVRVLDFGCGNGEFISMCRGFGFHAIGVDRSEARKEKNPLPVFADLDEVKSRDGDPFHAITLFEVLEHLHEPLRILKQLRKFTAGGAVLVLTTPDCTGVKAIDSYHDYRMINPLSHINGFTPNTLKNIAARAGFVSIHPPTPYVTADIARAAKRTARLMLSPFTRRRTQLYFRAD